MRKLAATDTLGEKDEDGSVRPRLDFLFFQSRKQGDAEFAFGMPTRG